MVTPAILDFDSVGFATTAIAVTVGDMPVLGAEDLDLDCEADEELGVWRERGGKADARVIGVIVEVDEDMDVGGGRRGKPDARVIGVIVEENVSLVRDGNEVRVVAVDDDKVAVTGRKEEGVLDCEVKGD